MNTFVPSYYGDFACLMGACRHSCCIGWEIDIDPDTLKKYRHLSGNIGQKLQENIAFSDDPPHFCLSEDERCPFLTKDGLCELILTQGEDSLCQICSDHPRFRNHFSTHTEMGLGLCCEGAARLILTQDAPFTLVPLQGNEPCPDGDEDETQLLSLRSAWIADAQNRALPFRQRLRALSADLPVQTAFDPVRWANFLLTLERLDPTWEECLTLLKTSSPTPIEPDETLALAFEHLCVYLLFRHIPGALQDEDLEGRLAYVLFICTLLMYIAGAQKQQRGVFTLEDFIDLCRMYSAELEYSDENLCAILDELDQELM